MVMSAAAPDRTTSREGVLAPASRVNDLAPPPPELLNLIVDVLSTVLLKVIEWHVWPFAKKDQTPLVTPVLMNRASSVLELGLSEPPQLSILFQDMAPEDGGSHVRIVFWAYVTPQSRQTLSASKTVAMREKPGAA